MRARGASGIDEIERENDKQMHIPSLSHFLLVFLTILSLLNRHKTAQVNVGGVIVLKPSVLFCIANILNFLAKNDCADWKYAQVESR